MSSQDGSGDAQQHPTPDPIPPAGGQEQDEAVANQAQGGLEDPLDDFVPDVGCDFLFHARLAPESRLANSTPPASSAAHTPSATSRPPQRSGISALPSGTAGAAGS